MICYRNTASGAYAELLDATPVAFVLRDLDTEAELHVGDDFDREWQALSDADALAAREWATNREWARHGRYCGVCNSGRACEEHIELRQRLDRIRTEIAALPAPRFTAQRWDKLHGGAAWRLNDGLTKTWARAADDSVLAFTSELEAFEYADRRNLEERIAASIHDGDTVEAEFYVTRDGVRSRRPIRLTVDRTPWTFGPGHIAITAGNGPTPVIAASIRVVARARTSV